MALNILLGFLIFAISRKSVDFGFETVLNFEIPFKTVKFPSFTVCR